jgi:hypothetical protein
MRIVEVMYANHHVLGIYLYKRRYLLRNNYCI